MLLPVLWWSYSRKCTSSPDSSTTEFRLRGSDWNFSVKISGRVGLTPAFTVLSPVLLPLPSLLPAAGVGAFVGNSVGGFVGA